MKVSSIKSELKEDIQKAINKLSSIVSRDGYDSNDYHISYFSHMAECLSDLCKLDEKISNYKSPTR